ncbi:AlpA family transcriptional regulator [Cellulomonas sp. APG4]|uniref:helix-turn-helix transcriptional regulator n=1 Tax=Cellulomonas sp. APG4 TaxID=1538656 RepID=UPI00192A393E|nr:helix-turn-helix domain-containing protein [Cellulomonas sp. APG4]
MTIDDLAAYLNVSVETVRGWRAHRQGPPAFKVAGSLRWRLTEVDAWLDGTRQAGEVK